MADLEPPAFDAEVIVVAQFPPPVIGQSTVNAFIEVRDRESSQKRERRHIPGAFDRSLGYHARRARSFTSTTTQGSQALASGKVGDTGGGASTTTGANPQALAAFRHLAAPL